MNYVNYLFFRILIGILWCIPMSILYMISDVLAFLLQHVFAYRKRVITQNIKRSFPRKTDQEVASIIKGFYRNLADITLESLKGLSLSKKSIARRYKFVNTEILDAYFEEGKHVIGIASHYGNWEWGPLTIGRQIKHRTLGIVKFVKNPYINQFIVDGRAADNVFVEDISRTQQALKKYADAPTLFVYISDQGPVNITKAQWTTFLNQKTPCLYGADRTARKNGWPVILFTTRRIRRGYYEVHISKLETQPENTSDGDITISYMKALEAQINEKPEDWLWSHRRWKRAHLKLNA